LAAFAFFFIIFFINQIILMAEDILSKNVPLDKVARLVFFSLPAVVAFALPFSSLVGALIALGRFSMDNEILAFFSSGFSTLRLFLPIFAFSLLLSLFTFGFTDYFIPLANMRFNSLYREVIFSNPALELESHSFKNYQDSIIIPGNVSGVSLGSLVIIDKDENQDQRIILSEEAALEKRSVQEGVISLRLENVVTHSTPEQIETEYQYSTSEVLIYNILLQEIAPSIYTPGPREMRAADVWAGIKVKRREQETLYRQNRLATDRLAVDFAGVYALPEEGRGGENRSRLSTLYKRLVELPKQIVFDDSLQRHEVEFHKKFSMPLSCLCFVCLAFPVGLGGHSNRSVGFALGIIVSIIYYGLLFTGQTIGLDWGFNPFWAMWLPNFIILFCGAAAFAVRLKR
jgi:lipopolysaccharide export system permease protein